MPISTANRMAQTDSSTVAGNSCMNSRHTEFCVTIEVPRSPLRHLPFVVQELLPHRLVEAELVAQFGQPLGRDAALAGPRLDRIAGHQVDQQEAEERDRDEGRHDHADPS